jgi:hypothetical protein
MAVHLWLDLQHDFSILFFLFLKRIVAWAHGILIACRACRRRACRRHACRRNRRRSACRRCARRQRSYRRRSCRRLGKPPPRVRLTILADGISSVDVHLEKIESYEVVEHKRNRPSPDSVVAFACGALSATSRRRARRRRRRAYRRRARRHRACRHCACRRKACRRRSALAAAALAAARWPNQDLKEWKMAPLNFKLAMISCTIEFLCRWKFHCSFRKE